MHPNEALIRKFYSCFRDKNYQGMIECYHPDVEFIDRLFDLKGDAAAAMWYMLCKNSKNLEVRLVDVTADDERGVAHWEADYDFSETGRRVHNAAEAKFEFKDGKIIKHEDDWDLSRWSRMALGPMGQVISLIPQLRNQLRAKARQRFVDFVERIAPHDRQKIQIPNVDRS